MDEDDEVGESDGRLLFLFQYLSKTLRFKVDKWHKMMALDDAKTIVNDFLNDPKYERLIFTLNPSGNITPSLLFPSNLKIKSAYFLKRNRTPLTMDNIRDILIFGDLAPKPLDQLSVLVEEIFVPMLTSEKNQEQWPKTVGEDIKKRVLDMKDMVYRVKGEVYGRTLLPMPQGVEKVDEEVQKLKNGGEKHWDMELRCLIESTVLRWSNQLYEVLKQTSSTAFEDEEFPTPETEFKFWSSRSLNLLGIYQQLKDPRVKQMATVLELTESAYFPCFQRLFKDVVSSLNEAREIDRYLKSIVHFIEKLRETPFNEAEELFLPLVYTIGLIWVHCPYFMSSTKLAVLIKEICNLLMAEANKLLDPSGLFLGEIEETLPKITKVVSNLLSFRRIVVRYQTEVLKIFPPGKQAIPWIFDTAQVFRKYDKYVKRLNLIKELFETTFEYNKLEKVEVGGHRADSLSKRLTSIFDNFTQIYTSFTNIQYDPTDIKNPSFAKDYQKFKTSILDFDRRLAAIASLAFDDTTNFEQIFKMINIFGGLLHREEVRKEIEPKYGKIITLFEEEVKIVKEIMNEQNKIYEKFGCVDVPRNWPPVAGTILWVRSLKKRLLFPLDYIVAFDHPVSKSGEAEIIKFEARKLLEELDQLEREVFLRWKDRVPHDIEIHLKGSLLKFKDGKMIRLNFDNKLSQALREVKYLKMIEVDNLPEKALELFERNEEFHNWNITLTKITQWYNRMRERSKPEEFNIVEDEISIIDELIHKMIKQNNWNSSDNDVCIQQLYDIVWQLTDRMYQAQDNLQKITDLMNQWNFQPLYDRGKTKKDDLLVFTDMVEINKRYNSIIENGQKVYDLIDINFRLLHNLPLEVNETEDEGEKEKEEENEEDWVEGNVEEDDDEQVITKEDSEQQKPEEKDEDDDPELKKLIELTERLNKYDKNDEDEFSNIVRESLNNIQSLFRRDKFEFEKRAKSMEERRSRLINIVKTKRQYLSPQKDTIDAALKLKTFDELDDENLSSMRFYNSFKESFDAEIEDEDEEDDMEECANLDERPSERARKISELWKKEKNVKTGEEKDKIIPKHPAVVRKLKLEIKRKKKREKDLLYKRHKKLLEVWSKWYKEMEKSRSGVLKVDKGSQAVDILTEETVIEETQKMVEEHRKCSIVGMDLRTSFAQNHQQSFSSFKYEKPPMQYYKEFISNILQNPVKLLKWDKYLDMVDEVVENGLLRAVGAAAGFFIDQMEAVSRHGALFEVRMLLNEPEIVFEPIMSPDRDNQDTLSGILNMILNDINAMALLVPRVSFNKQHKTYMDDIIVHDDIFTMESEVIQRCVQVISKTEYFVKPYYKYDYLWNECMSEHLRQFLKFSKILTPEELEKEDKVDDELMPLLPEQPPTNEDFRKMIDSYDDLFKEISDMKSEKMISSWIRIDMRLFKTALLNICGKWGMLYKQYIMDDIVEKLEELDEFVEEAKVGLTKTLSKGDYDGLVSVMGYLLKVKQRQDETDYMFDPIIEVMALLKSYGLELPDRVYNLLSELPGRWDSLKKLASQVRITATPLMQEESNTIRRRLSFFDVRQNLYKTKFKNKIFFSWECPEPYDEIDKANKEVDSLEELCVKLAEQANLFEVLVPEFKVLKQIRKDTKLLKILWDYILIVRAWIHEWESTEWKKIDSESMDMELKKFSKEIRTLDKDMRNWDIYLKLESIIKNMITALRAITELQNPAIRDRHWKQLMAATKVGVKLENIFPYSSKDTKHCGKCGASYNVFSLDHHL